MKNIFIAGGGGYLGTKLTQNLIKNYNIVVLDRFYFGETLQNLRENKNLKIIKDDIRYFNKKHLKGIDTVINLASLSNDPSSELNPYYTKQINYLGAKRLAKISKEMNVKKYIFASSCSVYGHGNNLLDEKSALLPVSEYAKSKIKAENKLISESDKNFRVLIFRLATLYGLSELKMRFDIMVNVMTLHAWKNNKIFILGGGNQWRPLLHIQDAVDAFKRGIDYNPKNNYEIFNIGSTKQNYQTVKVAYEFKKYFPNLKIEIAPDDPDTRNYKVDFLKAQKLLKLNPNISIGYGIKEIKRALENEEINDSIITNTHKYYKYLIDSDKILNEVKLKNKLF